jgi:hypothetical protein
MEASARLFNCARCSRQVIICSCCDRSNIYCCSECSQLARKKSLREAGKRYQNGLKGRHKHADRQKRYRQRLAKKIKIVTHHTSPILSDNGLLPKPCEQEKRLMRPATKTVHCHFCGSHCSPFIRFRFLRKQISNGTSSFSSWPSGP